MSNKITIAGILVLVALVAFFVFAKSGSTSSVPLTGNAVSGNQEAQVVKLSMQNGQYVFTPSEFKKGVPVRIEAEVNKLPGCAKAVVISAFNIRKNLNSNDNVIEFTPDKAGTFNIACTMNMYHGTFTVTENDGTKPVYVEEKAAAGSGSCNMNNGGGCGCGN